MEDQLIDFVLHRKIVSAARDAAEARRDSRDLRHTINDLEERVGRLTLACTAMWELLRGRLDLTDDDLMSYIEEVDLRDGQLDGQHKPRGSLCPECGRKNNTRRLTCMFCESTITRSPLP